MRDKMMAQIVPNPTRFMSLASNVVIVSGGASGIGAALTTLLHSHGAHVFFGDISIHSGHELEASLASSTTESPLPGSATFLQCDVSQYAGIYKLFRTAYDTHGRIDHAISCAGVLERGNFFTDPSVTIDSIATDTGDTSVLDINLTGSLNFARIASAFLRQQSKPAPSSPQHKSITFLSSIAAIRDSPGMPLYQTSKVAILGLIRGMRTLDLSYPSDDSNTKTAIRINAICPGMTSSNMTSHLIPHFQAAQQQALQNPNSNPKVKTGHWQTSPDVAEFIAHLMVNSDIHGKSVYVEGGKGWEFEDGLQETMSVWLGEEPSRMLRENREFIKGLGGIRKD